MQEADIVIPDMCETHQRLLVEQCRYGPDDKWQALFIAAQIALLNFISFNKTSMKKLDGSLRNLHRFSCMACERPDGFGQIVEAAKGKDLEQVSKLITKWRLNFEKELQNKMNVNEWADKIYKQNVEVGW